MPEAPNNIRTLRKSRKISAADLAEKVEISVPFLYQLELGSRRLNSDHIPRFAAALGVSAQEIVTGDARTVEVDGYVEDNGRVAMSPAGTVAVPSLFDERWVQAIEVATASLQPVFSPGDMLFFDEPAEDAAIALNHGKAQFDRINVVRTFDGRTFVRQITRGDRPGTYHLIPITRAGEAEYNAQLRWAQPIRLALAKDDLRGREA
ncbi:MAG: helix-turn-helix transcriptional regulator [Pseudomonadota bacterium]